MESDLISRSAAMKSLSKVFGIPLDYDGNCDEMCDEAFAAIDALPSIDAVPVVHGHIVWKDRRRGGVRKATGRDEFGVEHTVRYMESYVERTPYCSVCTKVLGDALTYCPNCGARMDGEKSEEEG